MDLLSIAQIVVRRWYVTLPVLLLTGLAAWLVHSNVPPSFEARGSVLLATPELDPSRLPSAVVNVSDLIDRLEDPAVAEQVVTGGTEILARVRDGATIDVTATASQGGAAEQTINAMLDWISQQVREVQEEAAIPEDERLRPRILTPVVVAEEQVDGQFQASGALLLEDPTAHTVNPYGASTGTGRLIEVAIESDEGRQRVAERTGGRISFDISQAQRDSAPIVQIATFGDDPQVTLDGFGQVVEIVGEELDTRQARAQVPTSRRTTLEVIAAPQDVANVSPPLSRSVAAVVGVGGMLALGLAIAVESLATRRSGSAAKGRRGSRPDDWWVGDLDEVRDAESQLAAEDRRRTKTQVSRPDPR